MNVRRVAITGFGVVSPVGSGSAAFFDTLLSARSGIRRLTGPLAGVFHDVVAGEVDFDSTAHFPRARLALLDRTSQFALVAAREAIGQAGMVFDEALKQEMGVFIGTSMGGNQTLESGYEELFREGRDRLPPYTVLRSMHNASAGHISFEYGLRGPSLTYANACSSSAVAIGEAFRAIRHGYVRVAVAGGTESMNTLGTLRAWEALRAMAHADARDPSASCRPFSKDRTGLVLGEGAGMLVLEDLDHARARGAGVLAELVGYGAASDASHIAQPHAAGQVLAMQRALDDAGLDASAIDYINAHGTATPAGDAIEMAAIKQVFSDHARRLAVSSTKSMHGHLMGAAGAVEFIAAVMAIGRQALPPTANLRVQDPACDLDCVANEARRKVSVNTVMSNSFAFGGSNAVLVARRESR